MAVLRHKLNFIRGGGGGVKGGGGCAEKELVGQNTNT